MKMTPEAFHTWSQRLQLEFWAIYTMERDDDVLEYYEQSSRIPLSYRAKSGRRTTQWHTPDFFTLCANW
jgi:putative transposase